MLIIYCAYTGKDWLSVTEYFKEKLNKHLHISANIKLLNSYYELINGYY